MGKLAIQLLFLITFFLLVSHILPITSQEVGEQVAAGYQGASLVHTDFVYHTRTDRCTQTKLWDQWHETCSRQYRHARPWIFKHFCFLGLNLIMRIIYIYKLVDCFFSFLFFVHLLWCRGWKGVWLQSKWWEGTGSMGKDSPWMGCV